MNAHCLPMGAQKAGATWVLDAFVRTPVRVFHVISVLIEGMEKKRGGRPSLYKPEFAELLRPLWAADNIKKGAKVGCA